jgi:hypothetical protein
MLAELDPGRANPYAPDIQAMTMQTAFKTVHVAGKKNLNESIEVVGGEK